MFVNTIMLKSKFKQYGFFGLVLLLSDVLRTRFLYSKARIIRFPIDLRGKKHIKITKGFTTGRYCRIEAYPENSESIVLSIGENVQINDFVHITAMTSVVIGNNVLMASKIYISDCSHGSYSGDDNDSDPRTKPSERPLFSQAVIIEDNVWLGESVSVLPGVTVGTGTVVGANSVVSRSLPSYVIAVGSPAVPIKKYNFKSQRWDRIKQ